MAYTIISSPCVDIISSLCLPCMQHIHPVCDRGIMNQTFFSQGRVDRNGAHSRHPLSRFWPEGLVVGQLLWNQIAFYSTFVLQYRKNILLYRTTVYFLSYPWTFSLNIGLNMLPLDSFMSCLHSLLGYYTGDSRLAIDCPCGVWCRGLTTFPLYVSPLFGNLV